METKIRSGAALFQKWAKVLLLLFVALHLQLSPALCQRGHISHVVGGEASMWAVQGDRNFYQTWAYSQQFVVGDKLVFHLGDIPSASEHSVVQFPDDKSFSNCDPSGGMKFIEAESDRETPETMVVDLPTPGLFYYGCSKHEYCTHGQKFFIKVWPSPAAQANRIPYISTSQRHLP